MVLGTMPVDARTCKYAFDCASHQGLCASTARCPQQIFKEEVDERGMEMFLHFQPPGHTATAQEVSHSKQPCVEAPLDTRSGDSFGCMGGCTHWGAGFITKMGFVIRNWGSKDFLTAFC